MHNIKLIIEYDGTDYHGWQLQTELPTVQGELEKALKSILQEKVKLISASRTDAGVHARGQVANFKTRTTIPTNGLMSGLNSALPCSIAIKSCVRVKSSFQARRSAKQKLYRYTILNSPCPSPLLRNYAYFFPRHLDLIKMREGAIILTGRHNFSSFCASAETREKRICHLLSLQVKRRGALIYIDIEADYFLHNMARIVSGTLLDIGRGKISPQELQKILLARDRRQAGPTLPPHGLCLIKVKYPSLRSGKA
ncbi:tRNA pseudouridine(38-40) synthase TruA [candidate division NPL-UPA2 bacterium Unc8]|uniref:tRNA pseudouridine synthase A n=1 Tax=candidate division NPL-UPA2 bacterium Unc8 TaxID=1980939 RepID=A0A399FW99_UNCN2|nr:tRNA pseudouridine synthase A [Bacillota bacterium]MBT9137814.1 tRNA pseudouridine synthase A [Bacillota bacterium]MBT9146301.1 tRNA pseudouridine synthase A [Bacillota bacterium]RII00705.1 MAG: tRNA pseudouridine(38-40) synthase TruA [candidate division NPL-UPA2 bacterium Unc8]